jgi:hypothetical protein
MGIAQLIVILTLKSLVFSFPGHPMTSVPQVQTFITDNCLSDSGCVSGCCAFNTGKCAGPVVAQERDGGCGFGDPEPNADSARAFGFTGIPGSGINGGIQPMENHM